MATAVGWARARRYAKAIQTVPGMPRCGVDLGRALQQQTVQRRQSATRRVLRHAQVARVSINPRSLVFHAQIRQLLVRVMMLASV